MARRHAIYHRHIPLESPMGEMAKIFWTGRSQAVRLPKAFRFEGSEVRIRREGRRVIRKRDTITPCGVRPLVRS